jgi:RNA polymerase sigma factor (sigma-70 family)
LFKKPSDIKIIEGIRRQDEKILKWLYNNYWKSVNSYVLKNSGSTEDVADVFQESIIILYKRITEDHIDINTDLKGYFYGIMRNVWLSQLRRRRKTGGIEEVTDIVDYSEELNDQVLERIINRAFQRLKPDQRQVLKMFSEGISYEDIALKMKLKNKDYAKRKKYLSKEALIEIIKKDPEYQEYFRFLK